jgi:hypothetical protein
MSNAFKLSSLRQRDDDLFARSQNFAYVAHAFIALLIFFLSLYAALISA